MLPLWHITLFGELTAKHGDLIVRHFGTQKAASLLAYLALNLGRNIHREQLAELFWPDAEPESARNSLSTALWSIRKALDVQGSGEPSLIRSDRNSVSLDPALVDTDVKQFLIAIDKSASVPDVHEKISELSKAAELYSGPLLAGVYEDWIAPEQERLDQHFRLAANQLITLYESRGRADDAINVSKRVVQIDPLNEPAQLQLIELLAEAGRRSDALKQFGQLEKLLRDELQVAPNESLQQVAADLRNGEIRPIISPSKVKVELAEIEVAGIPSPNREMEPQSLPRRIHRSMTKWTMAAGFGLAAFVFVVRSQPVPPVSTKAPDPALPSTTPRTIGSSAIADIGTPGRLHVYGPELPPDWAKRTGSMVPQSVRFKSDGKLLWTKSYAASAGESDSEPMAVASDSNGNVLVCGFVKTSKHDTDFLTVKFDAAGRQVWAKRYNGTANDCDRARSVATDAKGNVYVCGDSYGGDRENGGTQWDFVTIKYDPNGHEQWVRRFNSPPHEDDLPIGIGVDSVGNVYVGGTSRTESLSAHNIVVKYDPNGQQLWAQRYNSNSGVSTPTDCRMNAFTVTSRGDVYSASEAMVLDGYGKQDLDFLTVHIDHNGNIVWQRRYSGDANGADKATCIFVDGYRNVYVAGTTFLNGKSGPDRGEHAMVVKYDPNGNELWSTPCQNTTVPGVVDGLYAAPSGDVFASISLGAPVTDTVLTSFDKNGRVRWNLKMEAFHNSGQSRRGLAYANGAVYAVGRYIPQRVPSGFAQGDMVLCRVELNGNLRWHKRIHNVLPDRTNCMMVHFDGGNGVIMVGQRSQTHPETLIAKFSP